MNSSSSYPVEGKRKNTNDLHSPVISATILKFLRIFAEDSSLVSEIAKFWQLYNFSLGDRLLNYHVDDGDHYLYLVCEGKVRILVFDPTLNKQVSSQLLVAENTFGMDNLFYDCPIEYEAIAASDGCLAKLPISQLQQWLHQFPQLKTLLHHSTNQRQALISYKTHAELGSQTNENCESGVHDLLKARTKADLSVYNLPSKSGKQQRKQSDLTDQSKLPKFNADIDFKPQNYRPLLRRLWHSYPFVQQQTSSDCGAACLAMVGKYWGKRFSLHTLSRLAKVDKTGSSLTDLFTAAEKIGYKGLTVKATLDILTSFTYPWIAHWEGIHYVVVWRCTENRLIISDPAIGKQSLTVAEFTDNWTGYALLLEPTPDLYTQPDEQISLHKFWQQLEHYSSLIAQIIFASLLMQIFGLLTPLLIQLAIDRSLSDDNVLLLNLIAAGFLCFGLWQITLKAVRQYLLDYFAQRIDTTLLGSFVYRLLQLPLEFFNSCPLGDLMACVQENRKIQIFLTRRAISMSLDALMTVISVGLLACYNWQMTIWLIVVILAITSLSIIASPWSKRALRELWQASAKQHSAIRETITGIHTIKAAGAEIPLRWRWEDKFAHMVRVRFRAQILTNNLQLVNSAIKHLGITGVLWYGAKLVISQQMTIGQFVAFNMLMMNVLHSLLAWISLWDEWQDILISVEKLQDMWSNPTEKNPQVFTVLPDLQGAVKFDNVSFHYHAADEYPILKHISFNIRPQQAIGIVGTRGAGKTTLVNLLTGLYPLTAGHIFIDGCDITQISLSSLRPQVGVVPQESPIFSGNITENITLYNSQFTHEQVIAVAKLADIHQFIQALPLGYHTPVGNGGINLSRGQKQKIAIARALINKPKMLILDEATDSLESQSGRRVQANLARLKCTKFIITHSLINLCQADYIYVLDKGNLIEQGTHEQLMAKHGHYHYLTQQQYIL
ncbi:MAG: peptidase domain-containing ABC transporter [Richelia sp.]|nr:peptidase domain-containing ABC transporter [Richelia sp.]